MKRRRLYRYSQNMANNLPMIENHRQLSEFELGIQRGLQMADRRMQERMVTRHVAVRPAIIQEPGARPAPLGGFVEGFNAGVRAAQLAGGARADNSGQYSYSDLENARRRGFVDGQNAATITKPAIADESSIRKKAIDDMLENCRVVAESNPNMTSEAFLKAVRHRSKKI